MTQLESLALRFTHTPQQTTLRILDQTLLPIQEEWIQLESISQTIAAIKALKIRGAPLIGIVAALSLGQAAVKGTNYKQLLDAANALNAARPTAVNLMLCINRMMAGIQTNRTPEELLRIAIDLYHEDVALCNAIAENGTEFIHNGDNILTHCNTGGLATAGTGTALGMIKKSHEQGKTLHVYVDETRPLLQGARLTAWELKKVAIPYTIITDNMAGHLMQRGQVQKVIVGCDRIATNGDFANKIGTYALAVLAKYHQIPFYVVGPYTTLDRNCTDGSQIPIEQRNANEVLGVAGAFGQAAWAAADSPVYNPAFDITPAELVSHWILDYGAFSRTDFQQINTKQCLPQPVDV